MRLNVTPVLAAAAKWRPVFVPPTNSEKHAELGAIFPPPAGPAPLEKL
jgi:hypothetical protein